MDLEAHSTVDEVVQAGDLAARTALELLVEARPGSEGRLPSSDSWFAGCSVDRLESYIYFSGAWLQIIRKPTQINVIG